MTAAIFFAKTKMGWTERVVNLEWTRRLATEGS
jgi:hypothetical protein